MYNHDLEKNTNAKRQYNKNQRKAAAEHLTKITTLKKLHK